MAGYRYDRYYRDTREKQAGYREIAGGISKNTCRGRGLCVVNITSQGPGARGGGDKKEVFFGKIPLGAPL